MSQIFNNRRTSLDFSKLCIMTVSFSTVNMQTGIIRQGIKIFLCTLLSPILYTCDLSLKKYQSFSVVTIMFSQLYIFM